MLRQGDVVPGQGVMQLANDPKTPGLVSPQFFGLERHLHDFLFDNWDSLELGRDWEIYGIPGDEEAGYEFPCPPVGRIDILAKHRTKKKWLIVELKRNDTSDAVVGQALRYMGWVRQHLAEAGDEIHGLIIAREGDDALRYAVSGVPNLTFQVYEVEFRLMPPPGQVQS
jgi:RecB family endonuclease NucS